MADADTYFGPSATGVAEQGQASSLASGALAHSVRHMKASANAGQFGIDETGGHALIKACRHLKDWYYNKGGRLALLAQQPKLGSSHMAEVLKPYVQDVATNAKDGFLPRLRELIEVLDDFEASIQQAMKNYRNTDEEQKRNIGTSGSDTYYV
ncbi:MAG: hypothetical protein ACRDQ5_20925 [Sciscionella sp.]